MQWFKKHPEWLRRESNALSNDSNYREIHQARKNIFISHGNILVRLDKKYTHPILIVYTDSTPYHLPFVFPLQREFTPSEVEEFAAYTVDELYRSIQHEIKFYFELRHQNSGGSLCILEEDNLENGSQFYGITSIIKRVRDWYSGQHTGYFPMDSEEVSFVSHFNLVNTTLRLVYPESFLENEIIEGDLYASLFSVVDRSWDVEEPCAIYAGYLIGGFNEKGIIMETQNIWAPFPFKKELKTFNDFEQNEVLVKKLIEGKKVLQALWFHVDCEPNPFEQFSDLVSIIGNGSYQDGVSRFIKHYQKYFVRIEDSYLVGIRFPNRKGALEFQLFKVYKEQNQVEAVILGTGYEKMDSILKKYDRIEAILGEKLTAESFHQRNSKRADYNLLKDSTINIFGAGALGSEIADCIGKAGINLVIIDNQDLTAHNAIRHLAGLNSIGEKKVNAVADIVRNHNPFIEVLPIPGSLYSLKKASDLRDNSITISSLADDNLEGFINEQLVIFNKSVFYVRALRGGKVARIFRVIPGKDACFNCLTIYRKEKQRFIDIDEDPAYQTLKNECNNPIRPASAADLKFVAAMASRFLIEHLQNGESEYNHWIWSTEDLPNLQADQINKAFIPPHPNCTCCQVDKQINVTVGEDQIEFMQDMVRQSPKRETGGVLAGWKDEEGNVYVTDVSGPGPRAIRTDTKFEKDVKFCQEFLDQLYTSSGKKTVYVGEWHSHPSHDNRPSGIDIDSLSKIALGKEYLTDCPAMIIFSNSGDPSCTLHPAGKRYYHIDLLTTTNNG